MQYVPANGEDRAHRVQKEDCVSLPDGPIQRIIWVIRRLRDQNDCLALVGGHFKVLMTCSNFVRIVPKLHSGWHMRWARPWFKYSPSHNEGWERPDTSQEWLVLLLTNKGGKLEGRAWPGLAGKVHFIYSHAKDVGEEHRYVENLGRCGALHRGLEHGKDSVLLVIA